VNPALLVGLEWHPNRAGGLNRYFHGLLNAALAAGVPTSGIVTFLREPYECAPHVSAMAPEGAGLLARLGGSRRLARAAFKDGVALANAHFALYAWPWLRDLPRDVPLVAGFHGPWADEMLAERSDPTTRLKAVLARAMERRVYARASRAITLSQAFADVLVDRYGVAPERVMVVPGGADLAPFLAAPPRAVARRLLGLPEDRRIVLSVRRLARRMGLDLLIGATALMQPRMPGVLTLIAGTGHAEAELSGLIADRGLGERVRLLGFVPESDLPLLYAAADVSVLPSVALEGFGLTIVESLASGTPAVGMPVGGMPEVLRPFHPDLVTAEATTEALADALAQLLSGETSAPDPDACRAYATRFGWDAVFPRILGAWRDAGAMID